MTGTAATDATLALAFETSSAWGSVALGCGGRIIGTRTFSAPRRHALEFVSSIDDLCRAYGANADSIEHVFVSAGPGSFTGLRIGITAARTIALATGARVVGVPSLEVIAQNASEAPTPPENVAVILDAKRKRVYAATFEHREGEYVPISEPAELDPAEFLARQNPSCAVLGEGVEYHRQAVEASHLPVLPEAFHRPRAETVYRLGGKSALRGKFDDPRQLIPIYIRRPEAEEKWEQRQGNG